MYQTWFNTPEFGAFPGFPTNGNMTGYDDEDAGHTQDISLYVETLDSGLIIPRRGMGGGFPDMDGGFE